MYLAYSALLSVIFLLATPWWLAEKRRVGLPERLGRVPQRIRKLSPQRTIWIHAVSVGEVLAVSRLVLELQAKLQDYRVVVSTTTATGQKLARDKFGEDNVFYFPVDFAFAIRPYLRELKPELVVLAETEFWPRFLHEVWRSGARIAVVNARISDRSFPRYRRIRSLVGRILRHVEALLAQSDEDARRLIAIGAPAGTVKVSGNLKFDVHVREAPFTTKLRDMINTTGKPTVIVAGSTVEGEEELVLAAFRQVFAPKNPALLILAPRHPGRFPVVAEMLCNSGLPYARRSELRDIENLSHGVLLLDSIGELASVYSLADVAFVGGSLVARGGHNILEPALFGKPIVTGPYTDNFREIVEMFRREKAVFVAKDQQELAQLFHVLVTGDEGRDAGMRAAAVVQRNAGATQRTVDELAGILSRTAPVPEGVSR